MNQNYLEANPRRFEILAMWRQRPMIGLVAAVAATYLAAAVALPRIVILPGVMSLRPADGLPVAAGVLFGPAGAWGSALGYLLADGVTEALGAGSLFGVIGYFLSGYVAYKLWGTVMPTPAGDAPAIRSIRGAFEFLGVAVASTAILTAVLGWGYEIVGLSPFFVTSTIAFLGYLLASVVVGLPVAVALAGVLRARRILYPDTGTESSPPPARSVMAIAVVWLLSGTVVSVGYRLFEMVPDREFVIRGLGFLLAFDSDLVFGHAGWKVQLVLGSMFIVLLAALFLTGGWGSGGDDPRNQLHRG